MAIPMGEAAVLFDFGGTLDADGLPWDARFFALYRQAGGRLAAGDFSRVFVATDVELALVPGIARQNYTGTVAIQVRLLARALPDGAATMTSATAERFTADAVAVASRNRRVLESLRGGRKLAVVSNYQGNLGPCLDELGLGGLFSAVSDSTVIGSAKPDRRIFDATVQALGARAEECWMVGDNPRNDIAAAAVLGMRTCWLAPAERTVVSTPPTARIARLDELRAVLDS